MSVLHSLPTPFIFPTHFLSFLSRSSSTYLLFFPLDYLLIIPSFSPSFHSSFYLAPEMLSHISPPTTHFSFLFTEISGWQMINIWSNYVGKFNAFSVISPQSSNICKFLPELRKSSVTLGCCCCPSYKSSCQVPEKDGGDRYLAAFSWVII